MEIEMPSPIGRHAAWHRDLCEIAADPELFCADDSTVRISVASAQHDPIMCSDRPIALRLYAYVAGFGLGVEEKAVVRYDDGFLEAHAAEFMQRHPDQLQRAR